MKYKNKSLAFNEDTCHTYGQITYGQITLIQVVGWIHMRENVPLFCPTFIEGRDIANFSDALGRKLVDSWILELYLGCFPSIME